MVKVETYLEYEVEFLQKFTEGNNTVELLLQNSNLTETSINIVLEKLMAKNTIKFNKTKKIYEYIKEPKKDKMIVLYGNVLLPVTVIKRDNKTYVIRGDWYEFEGDIDIRNIIWNVELPDKNNKSVELVELLQNQVMSHKKAKIKQVEQYNGLRNLIVPYSDKLHFKLLTIGDELIDAELLFNFTIEDELSGLITPSRKLRLKVTISTKDLIKILSLPDNQERDFSTLQFNKIFNLTDFIVKGNCFPININKTDITYLELSQTKGEIILTEYVHTFESYKKTGEVFEFSIGEGFDFIRELFNDKINLFISESGIYMDE